MDVNFANETVKKIIINALPELAIQSVELSLSAGLHRVYRAIAKDKTAVQCSLAPSPNRRLLRCEYKSIRNEAAILQWLSSLCEIRPDSSSNTSTTIDYQDKTEQRNILIANAISSQLSKLLDHGFSAALQRVPYNIIIPRPGTTISSLPSPLTLAQRKSVDFQIGQMLRAIALIRSPTSRFGIAESIVPPVPQRSSRAQRRTSVQQTSETFTKWSEAFGEILNSAIQDAQANQITAAYDNIRRLHHRFSQMLDTVTEPRLVLLDYGLDWNTLVSLQSDHNESDEDSVKSSSDESPSDDSTVSSIGDNHTSSIKLMGMREWTKAIFGDPLLALIFSRKPSTHVLSGFSTKLAVTLDDMRGISAITFREEYGIQIRLNLYQIYHALNAISVEYIRRDEGSDPRELRARKALVEAVRELEALEELETLKRRRSRVEVAPSKRSRACSP